MRWLLLYGIGHQGYFFPMKFFLTNQTTSVVRTAGARKPTTAVKMPVR
jgi:hypothetical protein